MGEQKLFVVLFVILYLIPLSIATNFKNLIKEYEWFNSDLPLREICPSFGSKWKLMDKKGGRCTKILSESWISNYTHSKWNDTQCMVYWITRPDIEIIFLNVTPFNLTEIMFYFTQPLRNCILHSYKLTICCLLFFIFENK